MSWLARLRVKFEKSFLFLEKSASGMLQSAALAAAVAGLTVSVSGLNSSEISSIKLTKSDFLLVFSGIISVSLLFIFVLAYLNREKVDDFKSEVFKIDGFDKKLLRKIRVDMLKNGRVREISSSEDSKLRIQKIVEDQLGDLANKSLIEEIRKRISQEDRSSNFNEISSRSIFRISSEISSLEKRGNLNLSIGIVSTVIGIILLGAFVFSADYKAGSIENFLFHFLPRISLVIFVQVFSFFFLGLYKSNISEIKYYHNELTAVEARVCAIAIAVEMGGDEAVAKIVSDLSSIDRNSVDSKNASQSVEHYTDALTKMLSAIAPFTQKS